MTTSETEIVGLAVWQQHAQRGAAFEDEGEDRKWAAVDEYQAAHEEGATERQIADEAGKSQSHVHFMLITKVIKADPENEALSFAECYAVAKGGSASLSVAHVARNTGENEWYTPTEYVEAARDVMGGIDLDPASTAAANEVVKATTYLEEDGGLGGLGVPWKGRVWMNPPYARPLIDEFCAKLAEEYADGNVNQAITLTNNGTETGWAWALADVAAAVCFPRGRVKFWHPERDSATPLQGQMVFYLGPRPDVFCERFNGFGWTAER